MRVVSLLPSATEALCAIEGGRECLVGRSHECDWPPGVQPLPTLTEAVNKFENSRQMNDAVAASMAAGTGLYVLHEAAIRELRPDVVLTQSLCSVCSVDASMVEAFVHTLSPQPRVVTLNPFTIEEVIDDIRKVGAAVGLPAQAEHSASALEARVHGIKDAVRAGAEARAAQGQGGAPPKVCFLEWTEPLFPAGHYTPQLIEMAGGRHPINPPREGRGALPSAVIETSAVVQLDPDLIIVAPCGLDLDTSERETRHAFVGQPWWDGLRAVREGRVVLVDGNQHFNRPGPRLVDALQWLAALLHHGPARLEQLQQQQDAGPRGAAEVARARAGGEGALLPPPGFPWRCWDQAAQAALRQRERALGQASAQQGSAAGAGPGVRPPCAPNLTPDIEEAHRQACASGRGTYTDPKTGYTAFTEEGLLEKGVCCGNRCRHCPHGHFKVTRQPRLNRVTRPVLLLHGPPAQPAPGSPRLVLVAWHGTREDRALLQRVREARPELSAVLLVACDYAPPGDLQPQRIWTPSPAPAGTASGGDGAAAAPTLHAAMDVALQEGLLLMVVPCLPGQGSVGAGAQGLCRAVLQGAMHELARRGMGTQVVGVAAAAPDRLPALGRGTSEGQGGGGAGSWPDLVQQLGGECRLEFVGVV